MQSKILFKLYNVRAEAEEECIALGDCSSVGKFAVVTGQVVVCSLMSPKLYLWSCCLLKSLTRINKEVTGIARSDICIGRI